MYHCFFFIRIATAEQLRLEYTYTQAALPYPLCEYASRHNNYHNNTKHSSQLIGKLSYSHIITFILSNHHRKACTHFLNFKFWKYMIYQALDLSWLVVFVWCL